MKCIRVALLLMLLSMGAVGAEKTLTVTVVSSESIRQETGYETKNSTSNCVGQNCQSTSTTTHTNIPVRYLYVVMNGQHARLQAKQKFMTSYGKTLPPGDYQAEWKNSHTLTIHYTEKDKDKTADYEMAGMW